jgi:hypothetical protein
MNESITGQDLLQQADKLLEQVGEPGERTGTVNMKEDAVRWLNGVYDRALEKANEELQPYQNEVNHYKVVQGNPEYPFHVQIYTGGNYSGNDKFCKNLDEVKEFVESREAERVQPEGGQMEGVSNEQLQQLTEEMILEAQATQGMDLVR